jgi:hypothetical protein
MLTDSTPLSPPQAPPNQLLLPLVRALPVWTSIAFDERSTSTVVFGVGRVVLLLLKGFGA